MTKQQRLKDCLSAGYWYFAQWKEILERVARERQSNSIASVGATAGIWIATKKALLRGALSWNALPRTRVP
jgi:hypothetical protein